MGPSNPVRSRPVLVLSRKLGEKIYVGDNICLTVVDIDRGKVRIGIECPKEIPIYRQELLPPDHPIGRTKPPEGGETDGGN
jgi:carbon storage regulator